MTPSVNSSFKPGVQCSLLAFAPIAAIFFIIPFELYYNAKEYWNWNYSIPIGFALLGTCRPVFLRRLQLGVEPLQNLHELSIIGQIPVPDHADDPFIFVHELVAAPVVGKGWHEAAHALHVRCQIPPNRFEVSHLHPRRRPFLNVRVVCELQETVLQLSDLDAE